MIEKRISLREAGRQSGICRHTLRVWLIEDGFVFPAVRQGGKLLILERDVEAAIRKRGPQTPVDEKFADRRLQIVRAHARES